MQYAKMFGLGFVVLALTVTGCAQRNPTTPAAKEKMTVKASGKASQHIHGKGPHGGIVFDLGKHHAEFTVDHPRQECTIFILGDDEKTLTPVAARELTLTTKEAKAEDGKTVPPLTIKLLPRDETNGKATRYVGSDPALGNAADFSGTVLAEIDGRPSQGEFKEEEHDDHKHEKK